MATALAKCLCRCPPTSTLTQCICMAQHSYPPDHAISSHPILTLTCITHLASQELPVDARAVLSFDPPTPVFSLASSHPHRQLARARTRSRPLRSPAMHPASPPAVPRSLPQTRLARSPSPPSPCLAGDPVRSCLIPTLASHMALRLQAPPRARPSVLALMLSESRPPQVLHLAIWRTVPSRARLATRVLPRPPPSLLAPWANRAWAKHRWARTNARRTVHQALAFFEFCGLLPSAYRPSRS
ncbi:hypothetical protein GY45DRAFT_240496 [Cubamyces sp. BRFM 1775]|nr:hypothetical protein GY45DRAFT_240496 [Cubamyces sp. BRFM 1775]